MNILVLNPQRLKPSFSLFRGQEDSALWRGDLALDGSLNGQAALRDSLAHIRTDSLLRLEGEPLHGVSIIVKYGGTVFTRPEAAGENALARLESLAPQAPLHAPSAARLAREALEVFKGTPVVLVFETAFFTALPAREYSYALDTGMSKSLDIRRFGYHGLFHESACQEARRQRLMSGVAAAGRHLSICLEPRPEVAAVLDHVPMMVTGGATPLEGIPGQTSCGEIDPSIVMNLASAKGWGPEQINDILTRRSGILGLTGEPLSLLEILKDSDKNDRARELIRYRILLACGMGIAAMGGLDAIVFSGRYHAAGESLGNWLRDKIHLRGHEFEKAPRLEIFTRSRDRIAADQAAGVVLGDNRTSRAA